MTDMTGTVDIWLAAWTEQDEEKRRGLISEVWAPDGKLSDPPMTANGRAELTGVTAALQGQFPGHTFRRSTVVDCHHEFIRYGWELVAPDRSVALTGEDVAVVGDDGKLRRVVGFFGNLASS
jgi:hypothetical protein